MSETVSSLQKTGFFSEQTFTDVGDVYDDNKTAATLPRHHGRQFTVSVGKHGKQPDALFDKTFKRLTEGDKFEDRWLIERRIKKLGNEALDSKPAWRPSHPAPRATGAGSTIGCIGKVPLLTKSVTGGTVSSAHAGAPGKRNFYTAPAKRGGAGWPERDRTIGGTQLEYMRDDYMPGADLTRKAKQESRARIPKPFVGGSKVTTPFTRSTFMTDPARPVRHKVKPFSGKPFRPSNPAPKGREFCCISKVGMDHIPVPELRERKTKVQGDDKTAWRPGGRDHTKYTRSINPYECPPMPPPAQTWVWEG
ncbi:unnamed protein product [Pedinophyceae sp. YPF-701]|nr:unnamed protein product [Pedinophyceae sp. YPF-701]